MQGFENSTNPVYVKLDVAAGYGSAPIQIDGNLARATDYGLLIDRASDNNRHLIPWRLIIEILQANPVTPSAPAIPFAPAAPAAPSQD